MERKQAADGGASYGKIVTPPSVLLQSLARKQPYYKRNLPHVCSFYARGECNRGALCPYRHEMPITGDLANQNIKDRYYGQNDPVAKKMMDRAQQGPMKLTAPADKSICTLWVGGFADHVTEMDLREKFSAFGTVVSVKVVPGKGCGFVTYLTRAAAEAAADKFFSGVLVRGCMLRIAWGKKKEERPDPENKINQEEKPLDVSASSTHRPVVHTDATAHLARQPEPDFIPPPPPPGMEPVRYPSMNPGHLSAKLQ